LSANEQAVAIRAADGLKDESKWAAPTPSGGMLVSAAVRLRARLHDVVGADGMKSIGSQGGASAAFIPRGSSGFGTSAWRTMAIAKQDRDELRAADMLSSAALPHR